MSSIKVAVRCRPLFESEKAASGLDIHSKRILLDSKTYDPDITFSPTSTQDDVFATCLPIMESIKDGLNGTIMVYGQTGTGKTYTMLGQGEEEGLVHKVIAHMLAHVQEKTMDGCQCALTLSMIEIYNEKLTDMLSPQGDAEVVLINGFPRQAQKITLGRLSDAIDAVKSGLAWRHTASTLMNERSSRSHVVLIIDLEEYNAFTDQTDVAHLFLVDLAGSESLKKSQASGNTATEAGKINKSLLALKSVFLALTNTNEATRPPHVPYRDSKLTELLQDSIGGSARTLMIACISAVGRDIEETKSTLMYAVKARSIRNAANTEKEKLLIRLRSIEVENQRLRNRLQERVNERGGYMVTKEEHEKYQALEEEAAELRKNVEMLMKDSQASDARKHISESQTMLLRVMIEDKEAELQVFKQVYHDALRQFESQAMVLQKIVRSGVADAKTALLDASQGQHQQLHSWRSSVLQLLESPEESSMTAVPREREEHAAPPPPISTTTSPSKPIRSSPCNSLQATPNRRGRKPVGRSAADGNVQNNNNNNMATQAQHQMPAAVAVEVPAVVVKPTLCLALPDMREALREADQECQRVVSAVNRAFVNVAEEVVATQHAFCTALRSLESRRQSEIQTMCARLRASVDDHLQSLLAEDRRMSSNISSLVEEHQSKAEMLPRRPTPAHALPFEHIIRNACIATARSADVALPSPDIPPTITQPLDNIERRYQCRVAATSLDALTAVGNMASPRLSASTPTQDEEANPLPLMIFSPVQPSSSSFSTSTSASPFLRPNNGNGKENNSNNSAAAASSAATTRGSIAGVPLSSRGRASLSALAANRPTSTGGKPPTQKPGTAPGAKRTRSAASSLPDSGRRPSQMRGR